MSNDAERLPLTHVAIRVGGVVWSLPKPFRHHHIFQVMAHLGVTPTDGGERDQGFLDSAGRYLNRRQALVNASLHEQLKDGRTIGSILTSEDLW